MRYIFKRIFPLHFYLFIFKILNNQLKDIDFLKILNSFNLQKKYYYYYNI